MSLWEYQECLALYWNKTGCVYGVRVNIKNQKLQIADSAAVEMEDGGFAAAFSQVTAKLLQPTTHLIIAGGNLAGSVCFDLSVPPMAASDIKQAIQYELPRHIPCDPLEMVISYRILKSMPHEEGAARMLIRVFAVLKKDWNELITEFTSAGIKIDAFLHPYMVLDPLLSGIDELYLPDVDEDFIFAREKDSECRQMVKIDKEEQPQPVPDATTLPGAMNYDPVHGKVKEDTGHYISPMLMAAYGLSHDFLEVKNQLISLPREMVPERFRRLRISFAALVAFFLLLLISLVCRYWWDSWTSLRSLKIEKEAVDNKIKDLKESNAKLATIEELIKELEKADIGTNKLAKTLHKLSVTLPKDMWLAHLSVRGNSMDISIRSTADKKSSIQPLLDSTGMFKIKNSYTRRNSDGTENMYINLDFVKPPVKHEGK